MFRYYLHKVFIFSLSMALSLAIIILSYSILAVGLFHSDAYVESGLKQHSAEIIDAVNTELENTADRLSLDKEMMLSAVNEENISIITKEVAHNFVYGYNTSFANSTELYSAIVRSIIDYNAEHKIKMTDAQISRTAALAVDSINEALGSYDTARVSAFNFARGKKMMIVITVCAVIIIACIVALDLLNSGRHRKYNYIGMGLATAGAVNISSSLVILLRGLLDSYRFCVFEAYDKAIKYCFTMVFSAFLVIGVALFAVGFVMLAKNYKYFADRKRARMAAQLLSGDGTSDYMEDYYTRNRRTHIPGEEFEKDVKRIEFDD